MVLDSASYHKSKAVREYVESTGGDIELGFLPPYTPQLNAIEELWRQMRHAILDVPYVRFSSMCSDVDRWPWPSRPKLDIETYLYRKA